MTERKNLLTSGLRMVLNNKRYIIWFWLLNLTLAFLGTVGFRAQAHDLLDHHLYSVGLLRGWDMGVFTDLLSLPEFGSSKTYVNTSAGFAFVFFLFTAMLLPGVFQGYAATYRLPREGFFRACGRNLWRFLRLLIVSGIVMLIVTGVLFAIQGALQKKAEESTNELAGPYVQFGGLAVIFLVMSCFRIWFDLAETDIVLNDQNAVRKSIWAALKHTVKRVFRLLANYVVITIVAAVILLGGIWMWNNFIPTTSVTRAFVLSQIILFLLLIPRFWQRGVVASYWQQYMLAPPVPLRPIITPPLAPVVATPAPEPAGSAAPAAPVTENPSEPPQDQGSGI